MRRAGGSRPHSARATVSSPSAGRESGAAAITICPAFDAAPNTAGSNGMIVSGSAATAFAKSFTGISGRLGTPTLFKTSAGGESCGRLERMMSNRFLELRSDARSGVATMMTSSAASTVLRIHRDQVCGRSSTTNGAILRTCSISAS